MRYLDALPESGSALKRARYVSILDEFVRSGNAIAALDEEDVPKVKQRYSGEQVYKATSAAINLAREGKEKYPQIRVMRKKNTVYLINTDVYREREE